MAFIEGLEGLELRVTDYPTIGLAQQGTPEVARGIDGFKSGTIYTNDYNENDERVRTPLGEAVEFVVLYIYPDKMRAKYNEMSDDLPMYDCRAFDGKVGTKYGKCSQCGFSDWQSADRCNNHIVAVVARKEDLDNPKRILFVKSKYKAGEKLIEFVAREVQKTKAPYYGFTFTLTSKTQENKEKKAIYRTFDIRPGSPIPAKELPRVKEAAELVKEHYAALKAQFYAGLEREDSAKDGDEEQTSYIGASNIDALVGMTGEKPAKGSDAIL